MGNEGISAEEMRRDIADTEAEIVVMTREIEGFRLLGDRWSQMRADSRVTGIRERQEFIAKVQKLIADREARP